MSTRPESSLGQLRMEIDRIDLAIHRLILARTEIATRIGRAKSTPLPLRPGREAFILRQMAARTPATAPVEPLIRIWRELIRMATRQQGQLQLAVWSAKPSPGLLGLVHNHFGADLRPVMYRRFDDLLAAIAAHPATIGIVPAVGTSIQYPWWLKLCCPNTAQVIARLPFLKSGIQASDEDAFVIARIEADPSGHDRTLAVMPHDRSTERMLREPPLGTIWQLVQRTSDSLLIDMPGYIQLGDLPSDLLSPSKIIGRYAIPMLAVSEPMRSEPVGNDGGQ